MSWGVSIICTEFFLSPHIFFQRVMTIKPAPWSYCVQCDYISLPDGRSFYLISGWGNSLKTISIQIQSKWPSPFGNSGAVGNKHILFVWVTTFFIMCSLLFPSISSCLNLSRVVLIVSFLFFNVYWVMEQETHLWTLDYETSFIH